MVNSTTNHSFQLFQDGEEPWEHRTDLKKLDWKVIIKDTKANRPASPTSGTWYLATDEPAMYHYDGSAWNHVAGDDLQGNGLTNVGSLNGSVTTSTISNFEGNNLSVDSGGALNAAFTQVRVESGGSYTASDGESVWVDTTSGNTTINTPTEAQSARIRIKHIDDGGTGNTCTVSANSGSIDGGNSQYTVPEDSAYEFESDGTNWETF